MNFKRTIKAWKTIKEMLKDRNYYVEDEELEDVKDVREIVKLFPKKRGEYYMIMVLFRDVIGSNTVQEIVKLMENHNVNNSIVVYSEKVTTAASTGILHLSRLGKVIEVFSESSLQYNVTHHEYVPKHTICSLALKKRVMSDYNIDNNSLGIILSTDPVCRYYGAKKGQLIEILRPSDSNREVDGKILYDIVYKIVK